MEESPNKIPKFTGMPKFDGGPKNDRPVTQSIKTFKSDVAETVQRDHISVVQMALAESRKREQSDAIDDASNPVSKRNLGWVLGSIALIVVACGALGYFYWKSTIPAPTVTTPPIQTDIIFAEQSKILPVKDLTKKNLIAMIDSQRDVQFPLGSIIKIQIGDEQISSSKLFSSLFARMKPELVRSLDDKFLLGLHAFSTNQPFLILTINNYDTAYAGMLGWEKDIKDDIGGLFVKQQYLVETVANASSTSSTSSDIVPPKISFRDKVIENKDTRVLMSEDGTILFFYTFVDKKTLVFTTNANTLREIIIRINKPKLIH